MKSFLALIIITLFLSCKKNECSNCRWELMDLNGFKMNSASYQDLINDYPLVFNRDNVCKDAIVGKQWQMTGYGVYIYARDCN